MVMNWFTVLALASVVLGGALEATDETFPALLESKVPMLLDIYASWCGHCKTLAPIFDSVADSFENDIKEKKIQLVKIDGDIHRKTAKKYKLEYFPTLKFIDSQGNVEDVEARDFDGLTEVIASKVKGLNAKVAAQPISHVTALNIDSFKKLDKPTLVTFTASWCGHCKSLKPIYEQVAQIYSRDGVVIANVDCTAGEGYEELCKEHGVTSYPTIKYFNNDGQEEPYYYPRTVEGFIEFINKNANLFRAQDGGLNDEAGRDSSLDELLLSTSVGNEMKLDKIMAESNNSRYVHVSRSIKAKGWEYVDKESQRLTKLLSKGVANKDKLDDLKVRLNVLNAFKETLAQPPKEDL